MPRMPARNFDNLARIVGKLTPSPSSGMTERLVQNLRLLVLRGRIKPGEYLPPERQLAVMLGVSRPSLRGALKALQIMGVLEVKPGAGNRLTEAADDILRIPTKILMPLKGLSLAELFEARRWIEAGAAATAAERANEADRSRIEKALNSMREQARNGDESLFREADIAFHESIAAASGNKFFIWFVAVALRHLFHDLPKMPPMPDLKIGIMVHSKIFNAIKERMPDKARNEILNHLLPPYREYLAGQNAPAEIQFVAEGPQQKNGSRRGVRAKTPR